MTVINQSSLSTPPLLSSLSADILTANKSLHDIVQLAFSKPYARHVRFNPLLTSITLIPSRTANKTYQHLMYYTGDEERRMRKNPADPETKIMEHQYNTLADYKLTLHNTILNCKLAVMPDQPAIDPEPLLLPPDTSPLPSGTGPSETGPKKILLPRHPLIVPHMQSLSAEVTPTTSPNTRNLVWDCADSYHVTNDISLLTNVHPIQPNSFAGINGSLAATHAGYLPFLPSINNMNVCYYSENFSSTLLSLGYIHACGGQFHTTEDPKAIAVFAITNDQSSLLDIAPHIPGSNTYLTSAKQLFQSLTNNPNIQRKLPHNGPAFPACPTTIKYTHSFVGHA